MQTLVFHRCCVQTDVQLGRCRSGTKCKTPRKPRSSICTQMSRTLQMRIVSRATVPEVPLVKEITSKDNPYVKHCMRLLSSVKYRQEAGTCLLVGDQVIREVLHQSAASGKSQRVQVKVLFVTSREQQFADIQAQHIIGVTEGVMAKLCGLQSVEGVKAVAEVTVPRPQDFSLDWPVGSLRRLLVLEGVQDPGNVGTLLRSALALGWQGVFFLPGCCTAFNDKAVRSSRGAAFLLPYASGTWSTLDDIVQAHGLTCIAAHPHEAESDGADSPLLVPHEHTSAANDPSLDPLATSSQLSTTSTSQLFTASTSQLSTASTSQLSTALSSSSLCLVLGSEGQGISQHALTRCRTLGVPMTGDMESLNVSVAGSILMFVLSDGLPLIMKRLL